MKPVRSSFPNALSPRRRRPSSVLVAACRAVAALPLSLSPLVALAALPLSLSPLAAPCRSYYSAILLLKPNHYNRTGFDRRGIDRNSMSPRSSAIYIYTHTPHRGTQRTRGAHQPPSVQPPPLLRHLI